MFYVSFLWFFNNINALSKGTWENFSLIMKAVFPLNWLFSLLYRSWFGVSLYERWEIKVQFNFYTCRYHPFSPTLFVDDTVFSPMCSFGFFVKNNQWMGDLSYNFSIYFINTCVYFVRPSRCFIIILCFTLKTGYYNAPSIIFPRVTFHVQEFCVYIWIWRFVF